MESSVSVTGQAAVLDRSNVDTDAILPKQFMKSVKRTGFGQFAFDEWRYLDAGILGMDCSKRQLNPDFELNQRKYQNASILFTRENFGCGSSREHAPWALSELGFRAIIAISFADIFERNCIKNGIIPITLSASEVDRLMFLVRTSERFIVVVDLAEGLICPQKGEAISFDMNESARKKLLRGGDEIEYTLGFYDEIKEFEERRRQRLPWLSGQ
ncbi:3-isopropylmalate dehydratase small subunit [Marinobacter sp. 71-i]|uniref:3-isopropylmalate dehydratase small subunit n=1 Tax=Marinobacter iranensis TaxID=2962607 RepID=A0ABT5YFW7_9GAMM|nr:3-isopropylmalate dehydratase small subunit [Marinobacter iranensis]MDF0752579.1 3-isopropylmalate dehydratase small subunit [Marinobacter iranensis]